MPSPLPAVGLRAHGRDARLTANSFHPSASRQRHPRTTLFDFGISRRLIFPPHILRLLVIAKRHKMRMAQVFVRRPLDKFELPDQHGLEPPAIGHLARRQPRAPAPALGLRQICKRTSGGSQPMEFLE